MTTPRRKIILLVEGHGDITAVPRLLHNTLNELGISHVDTDRAPMKVGEILELLQSRGYDTDKERRVLFNGLYTALNRRKDLFYRAEDSTWALCKWRENGSE